MGKSFSDWTQEIAERNNHEPEPKRIRRPSFRDHGDDDFVCQHCSEEFCNYYALSKHWQICQGYNAHTEADD